MQHRSFTRFVFFCLLIALVPISVLAQAPLSQTYTAPDQSFTLKYPGGMTPSFNVSTPTEVLFFSDDRSVHSLAVEIKLATGATTLDAAAPILQAAISAKDTPAIMTVGDRQVLYVEGGQGSSDQVSIVNVGILFTNGDLALIVGRTTPDDLDEWKSVVLSLVDTLTIPNSAPVGSNEAAATEASTAEATAAVTSVVTAESTAVATNEATQLPTVEVTAEATSTPAVIIEVTAETTELPTAEATAAITAEATELAGVTCLVTASPNNVNLRGGPGTSYDRTGLLANGETTTVDGQATGDDGAIWYRTSADSWLRSNLVIAQASCANVPTVTP
ncbi:MAG TPA: SH3 domain-containing protein [Phototrophicaceae bacterium]|nr:SH3 domain-containing protein [Phototrophicaceae bacterium]